MLDLHSIYKTFNAGTVNEKTALNGLNLHLNEVLSQWVLQSEILQLYVSADSGNDPLAVLKTPEFYLSVCEML